MNRGPVPPVGWLPGPGWEPDPSWPAPPAGWRFVKNAGWRPWMTRVTVPVVLGVLGISYAISQGQQQSEQAPAVGECARQVGADSVEAAPCSASDASLRVTSRVDGTDDINAACATDTEATSGYSFQESSHGVGLVTFVLCLADK